jgi:hypothetical protein
MKKFLKSWKYNRLTKTKKIENSVIEVVVLFYVCAPCSGSVSTFFTNVLLSIFRVTEMIKLDAEVSVRNRQYAIIASFVG